MKSIGYRYSDYVILPGNLSCLLPELAIIFLWGFEQ